MKKSEILELLQDQPEDLDIDKVIYTLWFRRKIDAALREADEDEGIPHEEVMREFDEWLTSDSNQVAAVRED